MSERATVFRIADSKLSIPLSDRVHDADAIAGVA